MFVHSFIFIPVLNVGDVSKWKAHYGTFKNSLFLEISPFKNHIQKNNAGKYSNVVFHDAFFTLV